MTTKTLYCNMLIVDEKINRALVLTKLRGPKFLLGKDNFPGGHIDEGETPEQGAIRETGEEANVFVGKDAAVVLIKHTINETTELYTYAAAVPSKDFEAFKSMTDEPLRIEAIKPYLASLALDPDRAAPDLAELINKGVNLLTAELARRNQSDPVMNMST